MKYRSLDGNRGTAWHPSTRHGCRGRILRKVSDVEVGDSQAFVATLFVIPEWDYARVQMKYHSLDGNQDTWRPPSTRRGCQSRILGYGSDVGVGNS